jgi:hypothetical protein
MHPRHLWLALCALAAFAAHAAVVYKWTDANGVVHYSDQPIPGAEKIVTSAGASNRSSTSSGAPAAQGSASAGKKPVPGALAYNTFAIASPAPAQTFFGDDVIGVHLDLDPGLKQNQSITWHLNGKELEDQGPAAIQFTLPHLDRGTYALAATITDHETGESQSTASVTFYVRQPSELSPLHQRP